MIMHILSNEIMQRIYHATCIVLAGCLYKGLIAIILDPLRVVEIMIISILQNYVLRAHCFLA